MKLIFFIIIGVVLFIGIFLLVVQQPKVEEQPVYQGAVPQGYDLDHFRKTGETIKEVEIITND